MRRYLLFAFAQYYPCGGWSDFEGSFDTVEEARQHALQSPAWKLGEVDDYHVIDGQTGEEVG